MDSGESGMNTAAIGAVAEPEFKRAQAAIRGLAGYCDYEDWLDARLGLQFGLSLAGVDAKIVVVSLSSFVEWCSLTKTSADERALDAFASSTLVAPSVAGPQGLALDRPVFSARAL